MANNGAAAKAAADAAFPAANLQFKGSVAVDANNLELLAGETEICSVNLNKAGQAHIKATHEVTTAKPCCDLGSCCSCTGCCGGCCSCCTPTTVAPTAFHASTNDSRIYLTITDKRILIREVEFASSKTSVSTGSEACCSCFSSCCCCCDQSSGSAKAKGLRETKTTTERMYQVADLKDVKFSMTETHDLMEVETASGGKGCCSAPEVVESASRDSMLVDVRIKLAFVKSIADYPGPWWQWFDSVKSSQALEILGGTMDDSAEAHKLRRALIMHQQLMAVGKPNIGSLTLMPGDGGQPPVEPGAAGTGLVGLLGAGAGSMLAAASNKVKPVL